MTQQRRPAATGVQVTAGVLCDRTITPAANDGGGETLSASWTRRGDDPEAPHSVTGAVIGVPADTFGLLLVDDRIIVREALRVLLDQQPDLCVLAQAANMGDAASLGVRPDVIITELELPDADGQEVVRALRSSFKGAAILVLTLVTRPAKVEGVLAAGANGYVLKTASVEDLLRGIRAVARGETYLQPSLGVDLARRDPGRFGIDLGAARLSTREQSVLRLLALGHTNAEIADIVGVSRRTVESHRAHIHQKVGCQTRAELVRYAHASGLVDLG
jgi:two-component system response regulator NreC